MCGFARFESILISWFARVVLWVVICLWFVCEFAVVLSGGGCDFLRFWVLWVVVMRFLQVSCGAF